MRWRTRWGDLSYCQITYRALAHAAVFPVGGLVFVLIDWAMGFRHLQDDLVFAAIQFPVGAIWFFIFRATFRWERNRERWGRRYRRGRR